MGAEFGRSVPGPVRDVEQYGIAQSLASTRGCLPGQLPSMTSMGLRRPRLLTLGFGVIVSLFAMVLGVGFANSWLSTPEWSESMASNEVEHLRWAKAVDQQQRSVTGVALGCGAVGAALGAWGWRGDRTRRFQISYFAGLTVLLLDANHVWRLQRLLDAHGYYTWIQGDGRVFSEVMIPLLTSILALLVATVLFLTALLQDRREEHPRGRGAGVIPSADP